MKILDKINFQTLIIMSLFLGLAPFVPEPHVWEKLKMLIAGELVKSIDIFDLLFHSAPAIILLAKVYREKTRSDTNEG